MRRVQLARAPMGAHWLPCVCWMTSRGHLTDLQRQTLRTFAPKQVMNQLELSPAPCATKKSYAEEDGTTALDSLQTASLCCALYARQKFKTPAGPDRPLPPSNGASLAIVPCTATASVQQHRKVNMKPLWTGAGPSGRHLP